MSWTCDKELLFLTETITGLFVLFFLYCHVRSLEEKKRKERKKKGDKAKQN